MPWWTGWRQGAVFGNDPEVQTNMQVTDFLGGDGRVFFLDRMAISSRSSQRASVLGFDRTLRVCHGGLIPLQRFSDCDLRRGRSEPSREDPQTLRARTSTTRVRVEEVLRWLPPDTETIVVAEGPRTFASSPRRR